MKKTRCLSLLLSVCLLLALFVPAQAAYSDLQGHWAEEYMEELAERGFLSGYEDGTMKPDKTLTLCEALVILSRFYSLDKTAMDWVTSDYASALSALPGRLSWAREPLGICLAAGIIKESEIRKLDLSDAADKEELAVFIVRTLRMTDLATSMASEELPFSDTDSITASYRGYVSVLNSLSIVSGDTNGKFNPRSTVTRAVASAMISRTLAYLDQQETTLSLEDYVGVSRKEGFLSEVGSDHLCLRTFAGPTCRFALSPAASIYVNNVASKLSADYRGCAVTLYIRDGEVFKAVARTGTGVSWASGTISSRYISTEDPSSSYLAVNGKYYSPAEGAEVYLNGKASSLNYVSSSDYAALMLQDGKYLRIYAYSTPVAVEGSISRLDYASTVDLRVRDAEGVEWVFPMGITALPGFYHGDDAISLDRLSVGDEVRISMSGQKIAKVQLMDTILYVTGKLNSVLTSADGVQWFLTLEDNKGISYLLDERVGAFRSGAAISLEDIGIGSEVTVSVTDDRITKVELLSVPPTENKLTGLVLGADPAGVVTLLVDGRLVYVETANAVMLNARTGKTVYASSLAENTLLDVYGSFTSSNRFAATVAVAE